ncbi:MAG TPA: c-type cytochrome [Anaerolineae bacterium]|nr:c-type cytochrome [Anaerolineae bacterium]
MSAERTARIIVIVLAVGLPVAAVIAGKAQSVAGQTIELNGTMSEIGGWTPSDITAKAGEPIRLRLTSDDVIHGFAVGQSSLPALDVKPGEVTETTLIFDEPGKYTFYCTRWCGPNHWRMRGTIEVTSDQSVSYQLAVEQPLYLRLGIDIDAPHPADVIPGGAPSAGRGAALGIAIPVEYLTTEFYRAHSPADAWKRLRDEPFTQGLTDGQVWDLVADVWRSNTTAQALETGKKLFAQNCAACHGENGAGDGVMAESLTGETHSGDTLRERHDTKAPADFTDASSLLGASPALLHGKIVRGGMGTGMPYWGPIFTEEQLWSVISYLWTFQFDLEGNG